MSKSSPLVSIITVTYHQAAMTCELLDSIKRSDYANYEVIVVDNAREQGAEEMLKKHMPDVRYIAAENNGGFSSANNLGIRESKGEYLFFVNNDAEINSETIPILLKCFMEKEDVGIVSPIIYDFPDKIDDQRDIIQYAGMTLVNPYTGRNKTIGSKEVDSGQYSSAFTTGYAHGAAMMVPRKVIDIVGLMPEEYFIYYEDLDWSEQIRKAGFQVYVEPQASIFHKESVTFGKVSPTKIYYMNRNRIFFMRKHYLKYQFAIFLLFTLFVSAPKNLLKYTMSGQIAQAKSYCKSIYWNFRRPAQA